MMHGKLPANIITAALDTFIGGGEGEGEQARGGLRGKKEKRKTQKGELESL